MLVWSHFYGKNKLHKSGIYRHTKKSERIYTGILMTKTAVTELIIFFLLIFKKSHTSIIFFKGENGFKIAKREGSAWNGRREDIPSISFFS